MLYKHILKRYIMLLKKFLKFLALDEKWQELLSTEPPIEPEWTLDYSFQKK